MCSIMAVRTIRIHPACAGATLFIDWPFDGVSIHPACAGVNPSASHQGHCGRNFPRMREGQPAEQSAQFCIGNSPRMRGGQPEFERTFGTRSGFTPHVRGSTWQLQDVKRCTFILPVCAGVNLKCVRKANPTKYSPRMRGGQPARIALMTLEAQFTPHARGSTLPDCKSPQQNAIHPVCAGVNPSQLTLALMTTHSPRMRGGQPKSRAEWNKGRTFIPHARGSTSCAGAVVV